MKFTPKDLTLDRLEQSKPIAVWIGKYLKRLRTERSLALEAVAKTLPCKKGDLQMLEEGKFHFKCGRVRQLLCGYGTTLADVLEKGAQECGQIFQGQDAKLLKARPFNRTAYYSVRLVASNRLPETPLFMGGDPSSYVWAVPLRRLKGDDTSIEFLELAERRSRIGEQGTTMPNAHRGGEIIYVIRGRVDQFVDTEETGEYLHRSLSKGDVVHFDSSKLHYVENASEKSTALLLVVRFS